MRNDDTAPEHDRIGRNRPIAESCSGILELERVAGGKPVPAFPQPAPGPAAPPAGRRPPAPPGDPQTQGLARRVLAWALHGPPWTYLALIVAGLAAALLLAGLKG
jgi:hypothetical protein